MKLLITSLHISLEVTAKGALASAVDGRDCARDNNLAQDAQDSFTLEFS